MVDKGVVPSPNLQNSTHVGVGKPTQGNGFKCYKCGEPGHKSVECRQTRGNQNKTLLVEETDDMEATMDVPIYDEAPNEEI